MPIKTVLCDDSAEISSVHDKEQGSENRPLRNAILDRLNWRQMTVERGTCWVLPETKDVNHLRTCR